VAAGKHHKEALMGWNAYLTDDRGHTEGEWNYTHNTNGMVAAALLVSHHLPLGHIDSGPGPLGRAIGPCWWDHLHGKSGPEGAALLNAVIRQLETYPDQFRDMDPPNGWGGYDTLLPLLREMRDRVPEWPTTWSVHG